MSKKQQFLSGCLMAAPVILGYIPIGIAFGMMAIQSGFTLIQSCSLSFMVYTGAGQMALCNMMEQNMNLAAILFTVLVLNLRHLIMSAVVMNDLRNLKIFKKCLLAFGVTDEVFAVFSLNANNKRSGWFFFGLAISSWISWNIGTFLGAAGANVLPKIISKALGISLYSMFIALLVPKAKASKNIFFLILLSGGLSWIFSLFVSGSLSVIIAALLAAYLGTFWIEDGIL